MAWLDNKTSGKSRLVTMVLLACVGLLVMAISFSVTRALTPLDKEELSKVAGRDGVDVAFDLRMNVDGTGSQSSTDGVISIGGGGAAGLSATGNRSFLVLDEIYGNILWEELHVDAVTINSTPLLRLNMQNVDTISGNFTVPDLGLCPEGSPTCNPSLNDPHVSNLEMSGSFNINGTIRVWGN